MKKEQQSRSSAAAGANSTRPLSALVSQILVAFTVEFDNEFVRHKLLSRSSTQEANRTSSWLGDTKSRSIGPTEKKTCRHDNRCCLRREILMKCCAKKCVLSRTNVVTITEDNV